MARFGPYELIERIGRGGMGEVYRAVLRREGDFEKPVVIKRILPSRSDDPAFRRMFNREARVAALLNHQHIVHVYDYGREGDEYFLAMELVDGADLASLLDAIRRPPLPVALVVLRDVARALDYAHRRCDADGTPLGIVHRDVSPGNVLLSREGEVKLTDFGLVTGGTADDKSDSGAVKGKYAYMSPEQTYGDPVDARSDLFGLGALAYELLTGRLPFEGPVADTLLAIRNGDFEPLGPDDAPPAVGALVHQCLRVHADERPESAGAVVDALERVLADEGVADAAGAVAQWVREGLDATEQAVALVPTEVGPAPLRADSTPKSAAPPAPSPLRSASARYLPAAVLLGVAVAGLLLTVERTSSPGGRQSTATDTDSSDAADALRDAQAVAAPELGDEAVAVVEDAPRDAEEVEGAGTGEGLAFAQPARLRVVSDPSGARLYVDGDPHGETPTELLFTEPGPFDLRLEADGFVPEQSPFFARPGVESLVNHNLAPRPRLSISGVPRGAAAQATDRSGDPEGCVTPCELALLPGEVHVAVALDGYDPFESTVTLERDQTVRYELLRPTTALESSWRSDDFRLRGGERMRLAHNPRVETVELAGETLEGSVMATYEPAEEGRAVHVTLSVRTEPWSLVEVAGRRADTPTEPIDLGSLGAGRYELSFSAQGTEPAGSVVLVLREVR